MYDGFLDSNVVVHAFSNDEHSIECRAFLAQLELGETKACLKVYVLHELTFAIPRYLKQFTKQDVARILLTLMDWPGIVVEEHDLLVEALTRWSLTPGLAFVDSMLVSEAIRGDVPVFSKNVKEIRTHGAVVPHRLDGANY